MTDHHPHPWMHARRILQVIATTRIPVTTEQAAHKAISAALDKAGIAHNNEVRLNRSDRIDILSGAVGIEIKIGHPRRTIWRQMERYAESEQIAALILATGTAFPALSEINGKPLMIADLSRAWL